MFTLKAQERVESCGFTYEWVHHIGDSITFVDEENSIGWLFDGHVFNPQNPQIVRELPVMGRCDCVYKMIENCNVYIQNTDVEVYDENFQYLFTFEDTNLNSIIPGESCYEYPSSGVYYLKIIEYLPWITEEFGWYKLQVDKYSDIEDIIDVSINTNDICSGDQICVNIENINFYAYYYIYWNDSLIQSGDGELPQQQYSYCFGPSTIGLGTLHVKILDECEGEANYYYNINVKNVTDFALRTQVCLNQNVTISTNSITWCEDPVQGATYAVDWGDGTASSGLPASHAYSSSGNYNVALTINSSLGTQTIVKQIQVNPLPNNVNITGHRHTCAGTSTYTITNPQQGTNYTWTIYPANHGSIPYPNTGTTQNITWNTQNFGQNPALLIITSNNGCVNVDTIQIWKCCWREDPANIDLILYDQVISEPLTNLSYFINGEVTFQGTNTYDNIGFFTGPEAKILINNNAKITFNNCSFSALCGYMWEGIIVEPGSRITVNGTAYGSSQIWNAVNGIRSENGSRFTVFNTIFNCNFNGINVQTYSGMHRGMVSKCTFMSTNGLDTPMNLLPPYSNRRGETGIKISSVNSIQIGNTASTTNQNVFKHLDYGVYIENSNVTLYNNSFGPMPMTSGFFIIPSNGYGVYALNGNVSGNTINVGNSSTNTIYSNIFTDCAVGIFAKNDFNVNVYRNAFNSPTNIMRFGTLFMDIAYRTLNIANCTITNPGIFGLSVMNIPYTTLNIDNNHFYNNVDGANETQYNIVVGNVVLTKINAANIRGNVMHNSLNNGKFLTGIAISNIEGWTDLFYGKHYPFIFGNTINYSPSINVTTESTKRCGIRVENCRNANIEQNVISCPQAISNETKAARLTGIYVISSPSTVLCQNYVNHRGFGIQFDGNSRNTRIIKNELTNNFYGFKFVGATIGNQANGDRAYDNKWLSFRTGPYRANGDLASSSLWRYRMPTGILYYRFLNDMDYYNVSNLNSQTTTLVALDCGYTPGGGGTTLYVEQNDLNGSSQEIEYFIDEVENKYYDRFNDVNISLSNQLTSDNQLDIEDYSNIPIFKQINDLISQRNYEEALNLNQSINPVNLIEQNMKVVNDVYLRTWAKGNLNIPASDYYSLVEIAQQSPKTSGFGVIGAWVMTQRFDNLEEKMEGKNAQINLKQNTNIVISPNPAKGQILIEGINEIDELIIFDAFGRVMFNVKNENQATRIINISSFKAGIYFIQFKNNKTGFVLIEKFVVL